MQTRGYGDVPYYHRTAPYYWQNYGYPPPPYYGGYPPAPYQGVPPRYPPPYQGAPPPYARTPASRRKDSGGDYFGLLEGLRGGIGGMLFGGDMRMLLPSSDAKSSPAAASDAGHDGTGRAVVQKI